MEQGLTDAVRLARKVRYRLRPNRLAVVCVIALTAATGCDLGGSREVYDPWRAAGVHHPKVASHHDGGLTTVTVDAETSLPLPDRRNQTGFGERVAKIAWRSHRGRIDTLKIAVRDGSGHTGGRGWQRAELETAFGPRLAGLDAGRKPPAAPDSKSGPFTGKSATRVSEGQAILDDLLRRTARDVLHADTPTKVGEPSKCTGGLAGEPTGELQEWVTLDPSAAVRTHEIVVLQQIASYWARQGLTVDISGFYTGNEDQVRANLKGVGDVIAGPRDASDRRGASRLLRLSGGTDCLKP